MRRYKLLGSIIKYIFRKIHHWPVEKADILIHSFALDHQDGGAFHVAVVGPFLEIVGGRDLYPEIEIISRLAHFLDQEADPGQMRENNMNAFNTVQMTLERMFFFVFDMLFKLFFIRCSCIVSCNK